MNTVLQLDEITVDVFQKNIKNITLRVYPPKEEGGVKVRISAPERMSIEKIRDFALTNLDWIKKQQERLKQQVYEPPLKYVEGETHYFWGKPLPLKFVKRDAAPAVQVVSDCLLMFVRPKTFKRGKEAILEDFYRAQTRKAATPLIVKWEPVMGVTVNKIAVQKMKTRWGTCNTVNGQIRLNSELAKKSPECFEYLVVHEMVHLLEPSHNARFHALMDRFMPDWRVHRAALNGRKTKAS